MHIALATCSNLPDWEVDDAPFHQALARRGVTIPQVVWDDPEADWSQFDAVLIRTTWDYMEKHAAFVAWAKQVEQARHVHRVADRDLLYARADFLRDDSGGLVLTEFEAVEPSLFFRHDPEAGERLADALCARVESAI